RRGSGRGVRDAKALIEGLRLVPHPEGGWYRETWRAEALEGERAGATAILFLLEAHQRSHWHRVDAAEIWLWHAGDPLLLSLAAGDEGPVREVRLGPNVCSTATSRSTSSRPTNGRRPRRCRGRPATPWSRAWSRRRSSSPASPSRRRDGSP